MSELIALKMLNTFGFVGMNILIPSSMSDIIDYSGWKFRVDQAATYFALQTFAYKFLLAAGGALGLAIAAVYGFDPAATSQTPDGIFGFCMAISWLPAMFFLFALIAAMFMPINPRRHKIIRRRLDQHSRCA